MRSITFQFIRLNALSASTNKIASLSSSLKIELKACAAILNPTGWPAQNCKSPAISRMFLLKVSITVQPKISSYNFSNLYRSYLPGSLSNGIRLHVKKASRDLSYPQYHCKLNFFAMSANALQWSHYYPQMMTRLECEATHLHLGLMELLLPWFHVQFCISAHGLFIHMHVLHIILLGHVVKGCCILEHLQDVFPWEEREFI